MGRRKTINSTILMSCIIVVLIASISGVMGTLVSKYMDSQYTTALVNYGDGQGNVGMCLFSLSQADSYVSIAINTTDDTMANTSLESYEESVATFDEYMVRLEGTLVAGEAVDAFEKAAAAWDEYHAVTSEAIVQGTKITETAEAVKFYNDTLASSEPYYLEIRDNLQAIMDIKSADGTILSTNLTRISTICMIISIALIVCALIVAYIISRSLKKSIADPVAECAERLTSMSQGDLHSPVPEYSKNNEIGDCVAATNVIVKTLTEVINDTIEQLTGMSQGDMTVQTKAKESYRGDLAPMLKGIETTCARLNDTLQQIDEASNQVDSGSDQVSSGAQALSQGATEQASSVEELAATINEISDHINHNADNAEQVQGLAIRMGDEIKESNTQMERMTDAMGDIDAAAGEISKVLKTIEDIAFQTNILALNAAVEAARAGAAGKGFAVVADEVRNLAGKSDEAAKSTTILIENAINAVKNGTQIANDTAASMAGVVSNAEEVTTKINQISQASKEQADAVAQVTQGIDQISSVVQTNSATAEESAAASEELAGQAALLKQLVSVFTLSGGESAMAAAHYSEPAPTPVTPAAPVTPPAPVSTHTSMATPDLDPEPATYYADNNDKY